ncbi:CU044_2847 family protein [Streptomyces sp. AC550_RSS872]|uniref:CU044_2847 family protein n=1 Tax=Streptomyces sp. AC550_RSS872 TaxID=2823689 RepID=UPI001C25C1DB|nr:CU044_2847 family protein [Streptomyces sp. AC550_RSS872]
MSTFLESEFDDGTPVRFLLAPAAAPEHLPPAQDDDLPGGMGRAVPVATGGRAAVASLAAATLRGALKPLGPLLREVHDVASAVPDPPSELSVTFGLQVGQDLKFGIVGGNGQAHLTVTASWKPAPGAE